MSARELAERRRAARIALEDGVQTEGERLWSQVDTADLSGSWQQSISRMTVVLAGAQQVAASGADEYVDSVLRELNVDTSPEGRVNPRSLSGLASDGRSLLTLLLSPVVTTKLAIGSGYTTDRALASGLANLKLILRTQVADAGRVADGVAVAATPKIGYVRQLTPPSCPRCAILAGRFYRFNAGFQRHPACFPAGVAVSGPSTLAASRRLYEGEVVIITTASGKELPATGNHPILTDRGWLPANLLKEGDDIVSRASGQRALPLVVPDEYQMPARIEDVWGSPSMMALFQVPSTTEDFHGDGLDGQVDVVLSNRFLGNGFESSLTEPLAEGPLPIGMKRLRSFATEGHSASFLVRALTSTSGVMGSGRLSEPLLTAHLGGPNLASFGHRSDLHALVDQAATDDVAAHLVAETDAVLALTGQVRRRDLGDGQRNSQMFPPGEETWPRWDAPPSPFAEKSRVGYASRGQDLLNRLSGQVELDRVVELRRVQWSGHVYNLTSVEGWYDANGIIVSNCDCVHIPAPESIAGDLRTDPRQLFDEGQITGLSKADTQAILDGADMNRVINAHRGMSTAAGRKTTSALAGRQGIPRMRLRPETIYRDATSRSGAIRLLRLHGYLR